MAEQLNSVGTTDLRPLYLGNFPLKTRQVTFTIANAKAGTVCAIVTATGKYTSTDDAANNGREIVRPAVLLHDCDASSADQTATVAIAGDFDASKLLVDTGITVEAIRNAWLGSPMFAEDVA